MLAFSGFHACDKSAPELIGQSGNVLAEEQVAKHVLMY